MSEPELSAELPGGGHALFTDRTHGNMSSTDGERRELGGLLRERLRDRIGVGSLARIDQIHGAAVRLVDDGWAEAELPRADGQLTARRDLALMVISADCLPVAIGLEGGVAVIHAGWRGISYGILERGVRALRDLDPARESSEMVAVIGPTAGACCYEVGPEVHAAFGDHGRGVGTIDLRAIARERLIAAGIDRVEDRGGCTICAERYFSHRREGERAGRMAGVAWLS